MKRLLPLPILTILLFIQSVSTQAADIVKVVPITNKVIMVHFDEGYANYGTSFKSSQLFQFPLDVEAAQIAANYAISSPDDPNYSAGQNPIGPVGRKSKATDFGDMYKTTYYVKEHWIYLELPDAMQVGKEYTVVVNNINLGNSPSFTFTFDPYQTRSNTIHVSQIGFTPIAPKYAYLSHWMGDKGAVNLDTYDGVPFHVVKTSDGSTVYSGVVAKRKSLANGSPQTSTFADGNMTWFGNGALTKNYTEADVWECDFSTFSTPGEYKIVVENMGASLPFKINADVYRSAYRTASKGLFWQRSGIEKEIEPGKTYPRAHNPADGLVQTYYQADWRWIDDPNHDHAVSTANPLDVWGWYNDAGDWDGYPRHVDVPFSLLLLYDLAPEKFKDGDVNNRYVDNTGGQWYDEGSNGIPDLLDEAMWLINYYKRAKDAGLAAGLTTGGVPGAYSGVDAGNGGIPSWQDTRDLKISAEDPVTTYNYAAAAAWLASCLDESIGGTHPASAGWVAEAEAAYTWATNNTLSGDDQTGDYRGARMLASLALYRYTQQQGYHDQFVTDINNDQGFSSKTNGWFGFSDWEMAAGIYGLLPDGFPFLDLSLQNDIKNAIVSVADNDYVQTASDRGYRLGFDWIKASSNGTTTTPMFYPLAIAYEITGNPQYLDVMHTTASYYMGGNPQDLVMMTGLGHNHITSPFHIDSWHLSNTDNKVINYENLPGYTTYNSVFWDLSGANKVTDLGWSGNEAFSQYSAYPFSPKDTWPVSEIRFENRESILGGEFTVNENNAPMIFAYGYLSADNGTTTPNQAPAVTLNSPAAGGELNEGTPTTFSANASDDESIYKVEYFMGWHKLGESYEAPYSITLDQFPKSYGTVEIMALATDNEGKKAFSDEITMTHNNSLGSLPFGGEPAAVPGIIQAENFDEGPNGVAYYDVTPGNTVTDIDSNLVPSDYRAGTDVDISTLWDDELSATHIMVMQPASGEWLKYTVDIAATDLYDISMRILNGLGNNQMSLILDDTDTLLNRAKMPQSGWWPLREVDYVKCFELPAGLHTLTFVMDKVDSYVKLNDIRINRSARVASVAIDQDETVSAQVGKNTQLTATVLPDNASCPDVNWYAMDTSVAIINSEGLLIGKSVGAVKIVVESQDRGFTDTLNVNVSPPASITSPVHGITQAPGTSITVTAEAIPPAGFTVSKVDFLLNGKAFSTDNAAPYEATLENLPAGSHKLRVEVQYDQGYVSFDEINVYGRAPYTADFTPNPIPGRIQFENYDHGGNNEAYYDLTPGNSKGTYRDDDVDIESNARVTGFDTGEWLEYTVDVLQSTDYNFTIQYTGTGVGLELSLDGTTLDTVNLNGVGWWPPKDTTVVGISLTAGNHVLRVKKVSGGATVDYMEIKRSGSYNLTAFNAEVSGYPSDTIYGVPGDYLEIGHFPIPFDASIDSVKSSFPGDAWQVVAEPQPGSSVAFTSEQFLNDVATMGIYTAYSSGVAYADTIHFIKRGTYDFPGSALVETLPLTEKIAMLHFDDGQAYLHGQNEAKEDSVAVETFNTEDNTPGLASSYLVSSPDDANYSTALNPVNVYRKSKPTEQGQNPSQSVLEHWIYLDLPFAMQSGKTYQITMAPGIANNGNTTTLVFDEYQLRSEAVHVNQVGYVPSAGLKYGYVAEWMGDGGGLDLSDYNGRPFHIVDASSLNPVFSGNLAKRRALSDAQVDNGNMSLFGPSNNYYGSDVYEADFSSFAGSGEFYLVVEGMGRSFPFAMNEDIYEEPFKMVTKFLYTERAGIAKEAAYTPFTTARDHHPDDIQIVRTSVRSVDPHSTAAVQGGEMGNYSTYGWYHDAGDWDGYPSHMFVPTALLATFESAPNAFSDGALNIPESGNGLPDVLDEAAWLISYFRRNINPDGSVFGARVTADYSGGNNPPAINASQDTRKWHVFAADPHTNFVFAGLAANYAYALELAGVSDSSATLLSEAVAAYQWANDPANQLAGDADKGITHLGSKLADLKLFAAASLYKYTGDAQYQNDFEDALVITSPTDDLEGGNNQQWGVWTYVTAPDRANTNASLKSMLKQATVNWGVKRIVDNAKIRSGRQGSVYDMPPIVGSETTPRIFEAIFAHRVADNGLQKEELLDYMYTTTDYFLGNNPLNTAWVSGLGERHPEQALHLDSWYNDAGIKGQIVDGIVPYGPVWHGVFDGPNCHCEADASIITAVWTHDADWGKMQSYPNRFDWPISEMWFDTRYSVLDAEFTVHQNSAYALGAYGYLAVVHLGSTPVAPQPVTGVSLNADSIAIGVSETNQLVVTITPADADNQQVTWESSNPAIATVSSNGLVTGVGSGEATVTVTSADGGFTDQINVSVSTPSGGSTEYVKINFQKSNSQTPSGYTADDGAAYGSRNGFAYGWVGGANDNRTRDRNVHPDQRYDTFNHMQGKTWEIALPNGDYTLDLLMGDPSYTNQKNTVLIEDVQLTDPDGNDNFDLYEAVEVTVTDGKLTIQETGGAINAKIAFVDIYTLNAARTNFSAGSEKMIESEYKVDQTIRVYPNPAESELSIVLPASESETVTLQLFSQTGVKVMERIVSGKDLAKPATLDISNMSKAVYMLRVTGSQRTWNQRIIVR